MNSSTKQYFEGYNVRGLEPLGSLSRLEFLEECRNILTKAVNEALVENGNPIKGSPEYKLIVRQYTLSVYKALSLVSTFFLFVVVLENRWANNDYTYRLCLDVDRNKWVRRDKKETGHTLWVIAREHLKSTIITCASTLRELLEDSNRTFCIFSYNEDTAKAFLGTIKKWITDCEILREMFPDVLWANPERQYEDDPETGIRVKWKWTQNEIQLKRTINCKEASVAASGISGGAMTGYHYSHLIFDDAETSDMVLTSEFVEQCVNSISNTFNCGQTANLNICFVGTFYAREDIYCRLIKKEIIGRTVLQPCYDEDNKSVYYSEEDLEGKRKAMTPTVWATQMLCDPSMSSNNSFNPDWILRWNPSALKDNKGLVNIYTFVDPAGTKTNKSDNTAIVTIGFDAGGTMLVIDMVRDKLSLDEKFRELQRIKRMYNPITFFYERVGMQADIAYLRKCMEEINFFFPIVEVIPKGSKNSRIDSILVEFKNGNVRLPYHCYHTNWQGVEEDMCQSFINDEFLAYPTAVHDDMLDALAQAADLNNSKIIQLPQLKQLGKDDDSYCEFRVIEDDPMVMIS